MQNTSAAAAAVFKKCNRADCNNNESEKIKFNSCSRCLQVRYCSRECQTADWRLHKPSCNKPEAGDGKSSDHDAKLADDNVESRFLELQKTTDLEKYIEALIQMIKQYCKFIDDGREDLTRMSLGRVVDGEQHAIMDRLNLRLNLDKDLKLKNRVWKHIKDQIDPIYNSLDSKYKKYTGLNWWME